MKELILSNNQKVMVGDDSYPLLIVVYADSFADVDEWKNVITEKNINGAKMDGLIISNVVFFTLHTSLEGDKVRIEFLFREKSENEILLDRISELEDVVNFLLMGGNE